MRAHMDVFTASPEERYCIPLADLQMDTEAFSVHPEHNSEPVGLRVICGYNRPLLKHLLR